MQQPNFFMIKYFIHLQTLPNLKNMNVQSMYVRLCPLLLGSSSFRLNLSNAFLSNSTTAMREGHINDPSEKFKNNPYYKKYAEKIERLRLTNPVEYKKRMKTLESLHASPQNKDADLDLEHTKTLKEKLQPQHSSQINNCTSTKNLDSILNLEKVKMLSSIEIRSLWIENYADKDAVCAVIPSATYQSVRSIANCYSVFVYPVPRNDGYEMFVGQFSDDDFHFTSLVNYQRHRSDAISQLSLKHYRELENEKGIVLMAGLLSDDGLSVTDAQFLSYLVQHFHMENPDLIKKFNESPNAFKFEDVINAMDKTLLMKAGNLSK